jgi:hypothetical protein
MASSGSLPDFTEIFCLNKVPKTVKTLHSLKKNTAVHSAFRPFQSNFLSTISGTIPIFLPIPLSHKKSRSQNRPSNATI